MITAELAGLSREELMAEIERLQNRTGATQTQPAIASDTASNARYRAFSEIDRHIEVSASRVEPASLHQVSVLFRDITGRKRAEKALRASEETARVNSERVQLALAAGAIIGTWFWDLTTDRFTVDEAFARAFGLDPALGP